MKKASYAYKYKYKFIEYYLLIKLSEKKGTKHSLSIFGLFSFQMCLAKTKKQRYFHGGRIKTIYVDVYLKVDRFLYGLYEISNDNTSVLLLFTVFESRGIS